ncbi:RDD family protein [Candidatus Poribacteria bacterium]
MFCRNCGKEVSEQAVMCVSCGTPPRKGREFCQNCGAETNPDAEICMSCGVRLAVVVVEYAGFWRRVAATIIDMLVLAPINWPLSFIFRRIGYVSTVDMPYGGALSVWRLASVFTLGASLFIPQVITWLYSALLESSPKQATLGKMALGIVVTDIDQERISFGRATGRYFAKIISGLTLCIGYIMAGFTEKKQALHDMMANCLVVIKKSG